MPDTAWDRQEGLQPAEQEEGLLSAYTCRDEHGGDGERGEQLARKAEAMAHLLELPPNKSAKRPAWCPSVQKQRGQSGPLC